MRHFNTQVKLHGVLRLSSIYRQWLHPAITEEFFDGEHFTVISDMNYELSLSFTDNKEFNNEHQV